MVENTTIPVPRNTLYEVAPTSTFNLNVYTQCEKKHFDRFSSSLIAVDCGALTSPTNGSSFGTATTFSNTIKFSCDIGFDLVGSSSRRCMADKTWSGEMPVCKGNQFY